MTDYQPDKILCNLEIAIKTEELTTPEPISGDRWLLSSAMQKAIRRGEVELAIRAATALWYSDRRNFWRRISLISTEDSGLATPDVVVNVLTATASPAWRRKVGDLRVGLYLVRLMCQNVKTRLADELLLQVERSGDHGKLREHFANSSDDLLVAYASDVDCSLIERSMALWFLAGSKKFPSELMPSRNGNPEKAVEVLRSLPVPVELKEACIAVLWRTQYPLSLFTPVIWQELEKQRSQLQVKQNFIPTSPSVEGLPLYAADMFTRTGQTCFRQLQKAVPELQRYGVRQVGTAVFYLEGGQLDKVITTPFLDEFSLAGELADAEGVGLPVVDFLELKECLAQNLPLLEHIRTEQLQRYFNGAV